MSFEINFDKQPKDFLKKLERQISRRIFDKIIEVLSLNPVPRNAKRVQGREELIFRLRVGDYRVLYKVNYLDNNISVFKIDKRSKIYN